MSTPPRATRHSSLFRRIYGTFVVTFAIAAVVVGTGGWLAARAMSSEWVTEALGRLDADNDALVAALDAPARLQSALADLDRDLGTHSAVYGLDGEKIAGSGPPRVPTRAHRRDRQLRRGRPVILPGPSDRAVVLFPLVDADGERAATVHMIDAPGGRMRVAMAVVPLLIAAFGLGAWRLSRQLTSRIGALEDGVGRIARGELGHRIAVPVRANDEIDELAGAVNDMAVRLERLVAGRRTLLANVSHELRTPISRVKVLLEILHERLERIGDDPHAERSATLARLRTGVAEMGEDIAEMEALIADLLTSGRLELRAGEGLPMQTEAVDLAAIVARVAARTGAEFRVPAGVTIDGDAFLLERLLSNLLTNGRRACPGGLLMVTAARVGAQIELRVDDEGPGIPEAHREAVFEPFRRLDDARSRDRGGVGLGLYLCRQICVAHGGSLDAQARLDGRPGASMRVRLPLAAS